MNAAWEKLTRLAQDELDATLAALPAPLRKRASQLPVILEAVPNAGLVADGIKPDTLGVFTGPSFGDEDNSASPLPPQIILFLTNLWEFAGEQEALFRHEIRTTYLHELGHYLGLEEDDLFERGLE